MEVAKRSSRKQRVTRHPRGSDRGTIALAESLCGRLGPESCTWVERHKCAGFIGKTLAGFVKCNEQVYIEQVYIITRKHLNDAAKQYPDAANEIGAWAAIVKVVRWHNFLEVRKTFKDADSVKGYVIFHTRQNRSKLITVIHYKRTRRANPGTRLHPLFLEAHVIR
jgi:mRNA-degrading endonuclease HigB of HigAB toxin-antitoxin module